MNIYIITFCLCLIADRIRRRAFLVYWFIVFFVFVILCFGYMVGTDWGNYEGLWDGSEDVDQLSNLDNDISFKGIMRGFQLVTDDFWIFNASMKIVYIHSLILFFKQYTNTPWLSFAITLEFTTIFLIIDCPMRYMMGISFSLYGIVAYLNDKRILAGIFALIGSTCHMVILVVVLMWLSRPLAKYFVKLNTITILLLFFVAMVLSNMTSAYLGIFSLASGLGDFAKYQDSYGQGLVTGGGIYLGMVTRFLFLLFPALLKDQIIKSCGKKGIDIVYFSCLSTYLGLFLSSIPTAFRLNAINSFYNALAICFMLNLCLNTVKKNNRNVLQLSKLFVISLICFFVWKHTNSYVYLPYSNSIPYILTKHLPYSYRASYNEKHFNKD